MKDLFITAKRILRLSSLSLPLLISTSIHAFHVPRESHSSLKASHSKSIIVIDEKGTPVDIPRGIFKALDNMFDAGDQKPIPLGLISVDDLHRLMSYQGPKSIPKCSLLLLSQDIHKAEILDAPRIVTRNLLYQYFADLKLLNRIQPENTLKMLPTSYHADHQYFKKLRPKRCNSIRHLLHEDSTLFEGCYDSGILHLNNLELDSLAGLSEFLEFRKITSNSITTLDVRHNKLTSLSPGILQQQCPKLSVIKADHNIITTIDTTHINQKRSLSIYAKDNPLSIDQIQLFRQLRPTFLKQLIPIKNRTFIDWKMNILTLAMLNGPFGLYAYLSIHDLETRFAIYAFVLIASLVISTVLVDNDYRDYIKTHSDADNDKYKAFERVKLFTDHGEF